jgi:hypothetical protein
VPICTPQIPHDLGSITGRRGGKSQAIRLRYGMVWKKPLVSLFKFYIVVLVHKTDLLYRTLATQQITLYLNINQVTYITL